MTEQTLKPELDLSIIRSIADGNKELEQQFITLFISETRKLMGQLEGKHLPEFNKEWTETAHKIKGGASNMGATMLQALCKQAQYSTAENTTTDEREALYSRIKAEGDAIVAYLEHVELGVSS